VIILPFLWGVDLVGRFAGDALIGHWKLDEAYGEIAGDSAGVNDGILHGEAMWEPLVGILDGAVSCDESDHIRIPNESTFDMVEQITVACWINIKDIDKDWQTVIAKGDSAWRLSTYRSEARIHFAVTGPPQHMAVNSSSELSTGAWHHVCGTYDGANIRIYIDGVEDSAEPAPYSGGITTNNFDVYIGDNAEKPNRHWRGMIDDVRIYNYALDQGEVGKLLCNYPAAGDVNNDCVADMADYAVLTSAWLSRPGDPHWNEDCDISTPRDSAVDMHDLNIFLADWLRGD